MQSQQHQTFKTFKNIIQKKKTLLCESLEIDVHAFACMWTNEYTIIKGRNMINLDLFKNSWLMIDQYIGRYVAFMWIFGW